MKETVVDKKMIILSHLAFLREKKKEVWKEREKTKHLCKNSLHHYPFYCCYGVENEEMLCYSEILAAKS